jgi:hypothetical protein
VPGAPTITAQSAIPMNTIEEILQHCAQLLLQCWRATGFGRLLSESERVHGRGKQSRVIVCSPVSFRFLRVLTSSWVTMDKLPGAQNFSDVSGKPVRRVCRGS